MLRQNGDFLIRTTEPTAGSHRAYVLSVMVQQEKEELGYSIERYGFDTIPEMINHHVTKGESITKNNDQTVLRHAVQRQDWELQHDQVECTKKLGEGAFGEVHKGTLKLKTGGPKVNVAVKMAKLEPGPGFANAPQSVAHTDKGRSSKKQHKKDKPPRAKKTSMS
ncbi:Tyrosine-protein kinase [Aphelenchoides fujianensis]|nr:Tyrosine-protein kinase [Aphelenchoides fujianensis]